MAEYLLYPVAVEAFQALAELLADEISCRPLLARLQFIVLVNVVMLQPLEGIQGLVQAGGRHAPGAYRRTDQMHGVRGLSQPVAKQELVERPEDQPLWPANRARHDGDVTRLEAVLADM